MNQNAGLFVCVRLSWADTSKQAERGRRKRRQKLTPPRAGRSGVRAGRERGRGGGRPPAPGLRIIQLLSQLGPGICKTARGQG